MGREADGPVGVLHLLADLGSGGGQRLVLDTLRHLDPDRFRVTVAHLGPDDALAPDFDRAGLPPLLLASGIDAAPIRSVASLLTLVRRHDIRLIHTHGGREKRLGEMTALLARLPCIQHVHSVSASGAGPPGSAVPFHRRFQSRLLERHFIAVSEAAFEQRQAWLRAAGDHIHLVRNGIDTARFTSVQGDQVRPGVRGALGIDDDAPVVVTVGRLVPTKAVDKLVAAMSALAAAHPDVVALVVGDGPQRGPLTEAVAAAGLAARFRFVGTRTDVPELLAAGDVFAFPTVLEGFGLAAVEAMAAGLPVVASDLPALAAIIEPGRTGLLVTPGDAEALAAGLEQVLADPSGARRMGALGRERAIGQFDIADTADALSHIYDSILSGRRRR